MFVCCTALIKNDPISLNTGWVRCVVVFQSVTFVFVWVQVFSDSIFKKANGETLWCSHGRSVTDILRAKTLHFLPTHGMFLLRWFKPWSGHPCNAPLNSLGRKNLANQSSSSLHGQRMKCMCKAVLCETATLDMMDLKGDVTSGTPLAEFYGSFQDFIIEFSLLMMLRELWRCCGSMQQMDLCKWNRRSISEGFWYSHITACNSWRILTV